LARSIVLIPHLFWLASVISFRKDYLPLPLVRHLDPSVVSEIEKRGERKIASVNSATIMSCNLLSEEPELAKALPNGLLVLARCTLSIFIKEVILNKAWVKH